MVESTMSAAGTSTQGEETKTPVLVGEGQEIPVRNRQKFVPDETLQSHELRRKLWDGQLPLKIDLALNDNNTLDMPRSLYVSIFNLFADSDFALC